MRIKAFTLVEIVVTLGISTFVILIAMMAFLVVNKLFTQYKQLNDELKQVYEVNFLMQKDSQECKSSEYSQKDSSLTFTGLNGQVHLKYSDSLLIRQTTNYTDTFVLNLEINDYRNNATNQTFEYSGFEVIYLLENKLQYSGYHEVVYDSEGLVDEDVE